MIGKYLAHQVRSKVWPFNERRDTLSDVLEALKVLKPIKFDEDLVKCLTEIEANWCRDDYPVMMDTLIRLSKSFLDDCSLCLDCIKGFGTDSAGVCRIDHPHQMAVVSRYWNDPVARRVQRVKKELGMS